jgi:hypothetical protein
MISISVQIRFTPFYYEHTQSVVIHLLLLVSTFATFARSKVQIMPSLLQAFMKLKMDRRIITIKTQTNNFPIPLSDVNSKPSLIQLTFSNCNTRFWAKNELALNTSFILLSVNWYYVLFCFSMSYYMFIVPVFDLSYCLTE